MGARAGTSAAWKRGYAIEAFDRNASKIWAHEGTLTPQMMSGTAVALVEGWPKVSGIATIEGTPKTETSAIVSAGRTVDVLELADGFQHAHHEFASTVLDAQAFALNGTQRLVAVCADGTVSVRNLDDSLANTEGDAFALNLGRSLRWGALQFAGDGLSLLAAPADSTDQLVCYTTDFALDDAPANLAEASLDDLVARAHEVLEAGR